MIRHATRNVLLPTAIVLGLLLYVACAARSTGPAPPRSFDLGMIVQIVRGKVTVTLDPTGFRVGQIIRATVGNGLSRTIYTQDAKSDCSIMTLERLVTGGWEPVGTCAEGRPPLVLAIGPGRGRTASIHPTSVNFGPAVSQSAVAPGTYRIRFSYGLKPGTGVDEPNVVFSPSFLIEAW